LKTAVGLAASTARNILALFTLLSTSEANALPSPVGAATATTEDIDISSRAADATGNTIDSKPSNGNTSGGNTGRRTVLIVLLDDNAVVSDVGECDVLVSNTGDGAGGARDGFDTDTLLRTEVS
jgi:hypothetical protein